MRSSYSEAALKHLKSINGKHGFVICKAEDGYTTYPAFDKEIPVVIAEAAKEHSGEVYFHVVLMVPDQFSECARSRVRTYIEGILNGKEVTTKGMSLNAKTLVEYIEGFFSAAKKAADSADKETNEKEPEVQETDLNSVNKEIDSIEDEEPEDKESEDDDNEREAYEDGFEDGFEHGFNNGYDKGYERALKMHGCQCNCHDDEYEIVSTSDAFMAGFDYAMDVINGILADNEIMPGDTVEVDVVDNEYGVHKAVNIDIYDDDCDCCDCDCDCNGECECHCDEGECCCADCNTADNQPDESEKDSDSDSVFDHLSKVIDELPPEALVYLYAKLKAERDRRDMARRAEMLNFKGYPFFPFF